MKASELCARVVTIINDVGYTQTNILPILNRGLLEIASGGDSRSGVVLLAPLPDLFKIDTVTLEAGETSVSLPDDFHRGIVDVHKSNGESIKRYDSYKKLLARYPGLADSGPVEAYARKGSTLYCQPAPITDTVLTVHYHRLPVDMVISTGPPAVDDTPDGIPAYLHEPLLVNYACTKIWSEIEQEGIRTNTDYHSSQYQLALAMLKSYIGPEDNEAENIDDSPDDYVWP